jgi:hypothetical protein
LRPGGRIRPHRPVADLNNTTINECTRGRGLERPGDGVAALFLEGDFGRSVSGRYFRHVFFFTYCRVLNPFRYSFGFCHASTVGLHTGLHNVLILSSYTRYSTKVVFTKFPSNFDYIKLNTPFLHTRGINMPCRISCTYLNFQRGITATPVALGSMIKCLFLQPFYQRDLTKNSTRDFPSRCKKIDTIETSCRPPQPTTGKPSFFFHKRGTPFLLIDHPAHPIGRGGSNQRELLASADSPSPCASLVTLFFR